MLINFQVILILSLVCVKAEKIIIDTDAGSDDAVAILLLLRAESSRQSNRPNHDVIAITCVYGNTIEENVEINVLKTLTVAGRSDILVYGGAKKPLIGNSSSDNFYGKDGFGDVEFDREILGKVDRSKHAPVALVELGKKHEGNISIVVLGPMTNIALAASLDENFVKRVNEFYVMAASATGLRKPGVEFNVGQDPESAFILFNSTISSQLNLVPLEAGRGENMTKEWRNNILGNYNSPYISFINSIEKLRLSRNDTHLYSVADAATIATMLWPKMITSNLETNALVILEGTARGVILIDYRENEKLRPFNA